MNTGRHCSVRCAKPLRGITIQCMSGTKVAGSRLNVVRIHSPTVYFLDIVGTQIRYNSGHVRAVGESGEKSGIGET